MNFHFPYVNIFNFILPILMFYSTFVQVQKNCIFALSSITRRFPLAQKQLIDNDGIQIFMSVFKMPISEFNTKLKVKIILFTILLFTSTIQQHEYVLFFCSS